MDEAAFQIDKKDLIEGLGKGLRVIEAFDDDHPRLTPSEAAHLTGLTRTAARRYLLSLVHFGYAGTDGKLFWLTPRVLRLSQSYLGAARLPRLAFPDQRRRAISGQAGAGIDPSQFGGNLPRHTARDLMDTPVSRKGIRYPAWRPG